MTTQIQLNLGKVDEYLAEVARVSSDFETAVAEAMLFGAEIVQEEIQALAPVDKGNLRDHIKIKGPSQAGLFIFVDVGLIYDIAYTDGKTMRYGLVMEYGSSHVAARSYIRAGAKRAAARWRETVKNVLREKSGLDFA